MADNKGPPAAAAAANGDAPGQPFYEKSRQQLKELLQKRRALERQLQTREETIFQKETEYLENTLSGNIITGFDNYTKGTGGSAAAARRKTGLAESNRVFSRSSISYNPNAEAQTPGSANSNPASHAPTPLSTSFVKDKEGGSTVATPTSATAPKSAGLNKKKKSAAATPVAATEDSETDSKDHKKVRTNFGAARK